MNAADRAKELYRKLHVYGVEISLGQVPVLTAALEAHAAEVESRSRELHRVLQSIIDDATGTEDAKRRWPIRVENYHAAMRALGNWKGDSHE